MHISQICANFAVDRHRSRQHGTNHPISGDAALPSNSSRNPPSASDGVNFVHEDDARLMIFGVVEHLSNQTRRLADVFVNDGARHHLAENSELLMWPHDVGRRALVGWYSMYVYSKIGAVPSCQTQYLVIKITMDLAGSLGYSNPSSSIILDH